jgi:hypothetical protein
MAIDVEALREHIETDLGDDALGRLLADAEAAIADRAGVAAENTIRIQAGRDRFLILPYAIGGDDAIDSIVEVIDGVDVTLDVSDWKWWGGRTLERLYTGDNARSAWWSEVAITFTPTEDDARRDRVTIDLVRLAVQHNALKSESAGDYRAESADYQKERNRILSELVPLYVA